jgi:hypothetical protein
LPHSMYEKNRKEVRGTKRICFSNPRRPSEIGSSWAEHLWPRRERRNLNFLVSPGQRSQFPLVGSAGVRAAGHWCAAWLHGASHHPSLGGALVMAWHVYMCRDGITAEDSSKTLIRRFYMDIEQPWDPGSSPKVCLTLKTWMARAIPCAGDRFGCIDAWFLQFTCCNPRGLHIVHGNIVFVFYLNLIICIL